MKILIVVVCLSPLISHPGIGSTDEEGLPLGHWRDSYLHIFNNPDMASDIAVIEI